MKDIARLPNPRLEVRDLRVVMALATAGTTARAAELLHLTQPAVSRALLAIEDKLRTRLFERSSRGLSITEAGQRLLGAAGRLLLELSELEHLVSTEPLPPTRLRIVCQCYTAYHWLPSTLAALREGLPDLELELALEHTRDPVQALIDGQLDVALLTTAMAAHPSLEQVRLFADEIVFVLSPTHPLSARATLTRTDLRSARLLSAEAPLAEARWFMHKVFGRKRVRLDMQRLPLTEAILDVARAGMGIGVLSEWMVGAQLDKGDLLLKRLATGPLERPWRLAFRKELRGPARRLGAALQATVPHLRQTGYTPSSSDGPTKSARKPVPAMVR
ncbi:MAG: metR [Myxococcaceae bacterium]|nr:metR [Myxococcaceae bacterium]